MEQQVIKALYYITHIDNLCSILTNGILSHEKIKAEGVQHSSIYDNKIIGIRREKNTPEGYSLWHYANLFFQPRNRMLYRVIKEKGSQNLAILGISKKVLNEQGVFITNGIAVNRQTQFYNLTDGLNMLLASDEVITSRLWQSWYHSEELKFKLMAECLVPNQVDPNYIRKFIVSDKSVATSIYQRLSPSNVQKLVIADRIGSDIFMPPFD